MRVTFKRISAVIAVFALAAFFCSTAFATSFSTPAVTDGELVFEITGNSSDSVKISTASKPSTVPLTISLNNTTSNAISDLYVELAYNASIFDIVEGYSATVAGTKYPGSATGYVSFNAGDSGIVKIKLTGDGTDAAKNLQPGETFIAEITLLVKTGTAPSTQAISLKNAYAYLRANAALTTTDAANMSHTFTFKPLPTKNLTLSALSSDATLKKLAATVNGANVPFSQPFSPTVTDYMLYISTNNISFEWAVNSEGASAPSPSSQAVNGDTKFFFNVTAEDGTTTKTYTVTVHVLAPGETAPTSAPSTQTITTTSTQSAVVVPPSDITTLPTFPTSAPDEAGTVVSGSDEQKGLGATVTLTLGTLFGLVAAEVMLFLLAFFAGYLSHKNAAKQSGITLEDVLAAQDQLAAQNADEDDEDEYDEEEEGEEYYDEGEYEGEEPLTQEENYMQQDYVQQGYADMQYQQPFPQSYPQQGFGSYAEPDEFNPDAAQQGYYDPNGGNIYY